MAKVIPTPRFNIWGSTIDIQAQLRDIVQTEEGRPRGKFEPGHFSPSGTLNVVATIRRSGKTTGLVLFIGERILTVPDDREIAVITPTELIAQNFITEYRTHFPTLREPTIVSKDAFRPEWRFAGKKQPYEVYIEEAFLFSEVSLMDICAHIPVVAGVGTIEGPTIVSLHV